MAGLQALVNSGIKFGDKLLQLAACSWVIHLLEILLPLIMAPSCTLVLLRPDDNLNMARFCDIVRKKEITFVRISPSMFNVLIDYLELNSEKCNEIFKGMRIIWTGGESSKAKNLIKMMSYAPRTRIFMVYGMSEAMGAAGSYLDPNVESLSDSHILPFGYPLSGYKCLLIDENDGQIISPSNTNEMGEIHLGGNILFISWNIRKGFIFCIL